MAISPVIPPVLRRPLLLAVPVFALLMALGVWQVQRLEWKTALLSRIAEGNAAAALPLPREAPDPAALAYRRFEATGRFDHAREAFYGAVVRGREGGPFLVTPLLRDGAPPLLVLRGWVREHATDWPRPDGEVRVIGFIHPATRGGWFTPEPDLAKRRFYALDVAAIGRAVGLEEVAPMALVALGPANAVPRPEQALPSPPNPHLGYAITWFGLASAWLAFFTVWARSLLRREAEPAA